MKKVLVIGGGGREDATTWKLLQSPNLGQLFVAPGNAGTGSRAQNVPIEATDINGLLEFALRLQIDLTIVGQDDPLAMGIVDIFQARGLRIFGPTKAAAQIEAFKVFSKQLMTSCRVPTAPFVIVDSPEAALTFVEHHFSVGTSLGCRSPIVIKANGLALGKGAYPCRTLTQAKEAIDKVMVERVHGSAGDQVIIEKFVPGQEVSIHAFCDGKSFSLFPTAQDHKPALDGDKGLNTGGMGTYSPVPWFNKHDYVADKVVEPILAGLREKGSPFVGCLYPGLKMGNGEPMVLEFNARFGDPEFQVYMRRLKSDLLEICEACVDGRLSEVKVEWNPGYAACVVMASGGYPGVYKKGLPITGIEKAESLPGVVVFHAGTKLSDGRLVTSGGRVLGVTAVGATLQEAVSAAYKGVEQIDFEGKHYRKDIGAKSLQVS